MSSEAATKPIAVGDDAYSIPAETHNVFWEGIMRNPLIANTLPPEAEASAHKIEFEGSNDPSIPINWRFAESISALKAFEGTMVNVLLQRKYGVEPQKIVINTDHAQLFFMSALIWTIDPAGEAITAGIAMAKAPSTFIKAFPLWDFHRGTNEAGLYRANCTNIYKTKDSRFFHIHGSMNPDPTLDSLGLAHSRDLSTQEEIWKVYGDRAAQFDAAELQHLESDVYKQAGTICWTPDEYRSSEHGKANAHVGLYEIHSYPKSNQIPCWWPDSPMTSVRRPLAGLKVVDLTRVIAGPAISRGLAELGASVMRITAPHLCDYGYLHVDLNWGKWNAHLDFRKEEDREKMRELIREADVVVEGYRPGVLDRWGLSQEDIIDLCSDRARGIIYVRENCYGWNGPWAYRSGWQQISDANCGVSYEFGRAMGNDEPVTPVFPNSDYCTGVAGVAGVIDALLRRAKDGGSYSVDLALNYYSRWLVDSVGVYPPRVWDKVWTASGKQVYRHYHNMMFMLPHFLKGLNENHSDTVYREENFTVAHSGAISLDIKIPKPVLQFPSGLIELGYNVGTRTNGVDQPKWPDDLTVEVVL